jgi:hypothetical protein
METKWEGDIPLDVKRVLCPEISRLSFNYNSKQIGNIVYE